jgi:hypothetical protein
VAIGHSPNVVAKGMGYNQPSLVAAPGTIGYFSPVRAEVRLACFFLDSLAPTAIGGVSDENVIGSPLGIENREGDFAGNSRRFWCW